MATLEFMWVDQNSDPSALVCAHAVVALTWTASLSFDGGPTFFVLWSFKLLLSLLRCLNPASKRCLHPTSLIEPHKLMPSKTFPSAYRVNFL